MDKKTARLLDANLNRACEGLRVVEDTARFIWNEEKLYLRIRKERHKLHSLTADSYRQMVAGRDSGQDVGRSIKENNRPTPSHVVVANLKRAQEAVRVLEEYSKVFARTASSDFKKVRYSIYDIEKRVMDRL